MSKKIPAPQQSTYLCKFDEENRSHLIEVKVTAHPGQRQDGIRDTITRVVEDALFNDDFKAAKKKQIAIELKDGQRTFKILSEASRPVDELDEVNLDDIRPFIKVSKVADPQFPKRTRQIKEIIDSLLQCWPRKIPVIALFWKLAVYPLSVLMRVVHPGKIYDASSLSFKEDPHSQLALEDAIGEVLEVCDGHEEISKGFRQGLDFAQRWRDPKAEKVVLSSEMAGKVCSLTNGQTLPLPGGYWSKDTFEPVLWSFQKDENGELTLLEMAYGEKGGETIASYRFANPDQEKIRSLLHTLFTLSERPAKLSDLQLETILGEFYLAGLEKLDFGPHSISATQLASPPADINMEKFKRTLITAAGSEVVEEEGTRKVVREDPLKIVQESIRTLFPEAAFSDKAFFSLHMLHSRLSKITKALPFLKGEQRKYWLNRLDADYKSLERQMEKANMGEGAVESWSSLSQDVNVLRQAVQALKAAELASQPDRLNRLNKVKPEKLALSVDIHAIAPIDAPSIQKAERLSPADYAKVEALKVLIDEVTAGDAAKIGAMREALESLTKRVNELLDGRHYESSLMLCHAIMPLAPLPSSGVQPDGLWGVLQNLDGLGSVDALRGRSEEIKQFSEQWSQLSHYFWETKIQTRDLKLKPDESVYLLSISTVLHQLLVNRKTVVDRLQQVDPAALTYEEECFQIVATAAKPAWFDRCEELLKEKYLRYSEQPLLAARLKAIDDYFKRLSSGSVRRITINGVRSLRSTGEEERICESILAVARRRGVPIPKGMNKQKLWLAHMDATKPQGKLFFPSAFSDQARHDMMFTSLLNPETSIATGMFTVGGFLKAGVFAFKQGVVHKGERDQSKKLVREALEQLGNQRLEICPISFFNMVLFGLVPRGTASAKKLNVEIAAGNAQQHLAGKRPDRAELHRQELGHPGALYGQTNSDEMNALGHAMGSDSSNPVEDFFLSVMDLRYSPYNNGIGTSFVSFASDNQTTVKHGLPVQEVFDLILQRPWLLDTLSKNTEGKPSREAQKRFYDCLFSQDMLENAIKASPEYFHSHAAPLRALLEKTYREKKTEQYLFLLFLVQSVDAHIEKTAQEPAADASIAALSGVWPSVNTEPNLLKRAIELWNGESDLNVKVDGAAYIAGLFSNSLHAMQPELIPQLQNSDTAARLLQFGGLLSVAKFAGTMPVLPIQAHSWIKEYLAPYLDQDCEESLDAILDKWVTNQAGPIGEGAWQRVLGSPMQWEKGGARVDLGSMQIVKYDGVDQEGFQMSLPNEILAHPDYAQLFGTKNFKASFKATQTAGEFSYVFKSAQPGGQENSYRLLYNSSGCTLKIERLITVQHKKGLAQRWHQLVRPKMPMEEKKQGMRGRKIGWALKLVNKISGAGKDGTAALEGASRKPASGIEQSLQKCGLWIDLSDKTKGVAFLGVGEGLDASTMRINVSLNSKGTVQEALFAKNNMKVVANNDRELSKVLSCLPEDQIVFLRQKGKRSVNEIHFVGQKIYLARQSPKHPWLIHGDKKLEGARWVMGAERGGMANARLQKLGLHIEDVGLTVKKDGQTTLLVWPQAVTSPRQLNVHSHHTMEFKDKVQHAGSPLKVAIDEQGKVLSSATGYLELAYLFAVKHEYAKAVIYLDKARQAKLTSTEERQMFLSIHEHFKAMPVHSCRSAAVKLKGLLAVRQVLAEQTNSREYDGTAWKQFLASSQTVEDAFNVYHEQLKRSPFVDKEAYFQRDDIDISLNAHELEELKHISKEAFGFMVRRGRPIDEVNADGQKVSFAVPTQAEIKSAISSFVIAKQKPLKSAESLFEGLKANEELLVGHFFEVFNLIVDNKLTAWDLRALFAPVQGSRDMAKAIGAKGAEKTGVMEMISGAQKTAQVDIARRILLSVAASQQEGTTTFRRYDLGKIDKLRKQVPGGIISFALRTGWAMFVSKRSPNKSNTSQGKLLSGIQELIPDLGTAGRQLEIRPSGFAPLTPPAQNVMTQFQQGHTADFDGLRSALAADEQLFGPVASPLLAGMIAQSATAEQATALSGKATVESVIETIEKETTINMLAAMREQEVSGRIRRLEEKARTRAIGAWPDSDTQVAYALGSLQNPLAGTSLEATADSLWQKAANSSTHLDAMIEDFNAVGCPLEGMDEVAGELRSKLADCYSIAVDQLPSLKSAIALQKELADGRCRASKEALVQYLRGLPRTNNLPRNIQLALLRPDDYSDEEVLHLLKQAYQTLEIADGEASKLLTTYLLEQAAVQVLGGEVGKHVQVLDNLAKQGVDDMNSEWVYSVTEARRLISQCLDFSRHLDDQGRLTNPRLHRKVLVCEASRGIIVTGEQLDLIAKMAENPTDWYELKVGAGKTSVVFPIVLMLLIEKGKFPTAVVKDELMQQNLDSLDRSTRDLIQRAGVEFSFSINDSTTPLAVQELYYKLLQIEDHKGYPITSVSSIIAVDHKMQLLSEELNSKVKPLFESTVHPGASALAGGLNAGATAFAPAGSNPGRNNDPQKEMQEIESLQKQLYYLGKIREKLSLLIIDEADDILNVICENNVGRGEPVALNVTLQQTMEHVMRVIHTCDEAEFPEVAALREALKSGQQVSLRADWVRDELMPELAAALLEDESYSEYVGGLDGVDFDALVEHLCTVFDGAEKPVPPECAAADIKKLGALKHILQATLRIALRQNPGIDVGTKLSDGFQVGPQTSGQEKLGTIFGDEYDLVVNHYLFYSLRLPEPTPGQKKGESFAEVGLARIRDQNPDKYEGWVDEADGEELITFINRPENFQHRMDFLRLQLFDERRLKRYQRQIVVNRQHIQHGREIGGMTGTLNKDAMPRLGNERTAGSTGAQKVSTQVILEAGALEMPNVRVVGDSEEDVLEQMQACAKNLRNKAIINQGFDIKKGQTRAVIEHLRQGAPDRVFVYVDSADRDFYIWHPGQSAPKGVSKHNLEELYLNKAFREKACFFFSPPDIRGTDFKIPPGKGACFVSPKCSKDDFVQTLGRMRKAPFIHSMNFYLSKGVHNRISADAEDRTLSYARLVKDINGQTDEEQKGKNLKSVIEAMKGIVNTGTRNIIFGHQKNMDLPAYWDPKSPQLRLFNTYAINKLAEVAMDPLTGWLEDEKRLNLEADFEPSVLQDTPEYIEAIYDAEMQKVERLEQVIGELAAQRQVAAMLGGSTLDAEALEWLDTREADLRAAVNAMTQALDITLADFHVNIDREIYPARMPSSGANIPTGQAQVQEVVQQQQQQQQQMQTKTAAFLSRRYDSYYWPEKVQALIDKIRGRARDVDTLLELSGMQFPDVILSHNFINLFTDLDGIRGKLSFCRAMVVNDEVVLITRSDYKKILTKKDARGQLINSDLLGVLSYEQLHQAGVYALTSQAVCGASLVLDKKLTDVEPLIGPEVLRKLVEAKWLLGMSEFSDEELAVLMERFDAIKHDPVRMKKEEKFCERFGTPEQLALMADIVGSNS